MRHYFYDIESLGDLFTVAVYSHGEDADTLEVFYLPDVGAGAIESDPATYTGDIARAICAANANLNARPEDIVFQDLRTLEGNARLFDLFGLTLRSEPDAPKSARRTWMVLADPRQTPRTVASADLASMGDSDWRAGTVPQTPDGAPRMAVRQMTRDTDRKVVTKLEGGRARRVVTDGHARLDYDLLGYNSGNYDMVMLAAYAELVCRKYREPTESADGLITFVPIPAYEMRRVNDTLFSTRYMLRMRDYLTSDPDTPQTGSWRERNDTRKLRYRFYRTMQLTGRNVDVARVGLDTRKVALKQLLGMLGYQILESDRLSEATDTVTTPADVADLIAYNASDVVNLRMLFENPNFEGKYEVKAGLLDTYRDLVYETEGSGDTYRVLDDPAHVRRNRLYADSTSQSLTSRTLCPDTASHLEDDDTLSFMYPAASNAAREGVERYDVLARAEAFFDETVANFRSLPGEDPAAVEGRRAWAHSQMDPVFAFYRSLRGVNFNLSEHHMDRLEGLYGENGTPDIGNIDFTHVDGDVTGWVTCRGAYGMPQSVEGPNAVPRNDSCHLGVVPYFDAYGRPTRSYALFSVGGIHGADYNADLLAREQYDFDAMAADFAFVRATFPDPRDLLDAVRPSTKPIPLVFPSGRQRYLKDFLRPGFKVKARIASYRDFSEDARPSIVRRQASGDTVFDNRYGWTSVDTVNHEDFKSYYPNLLDQMDAFRNDVVGTNRYHDMFLLKESYGTQQKALPKDSPERALIGIKRNGVKLQLNAASGAGGATFDNPIRMNNRILAMRCIGQLFSWQIGQTQASAGARIPSTNTDGLYTVMEATENDALLERASKAINILIEPERMNLVSKDSNNRVEWVEDPSDPRGFRILTCGGGDLTHWREPNPTKQLAHPAAVDRMLAEYLVLTAMERGQAGFAEPFDEGRGRRILDAFVAGDPNDVLVMLGMVLSASPSVKSYPFAVTAYGTRSLRRLGHYTRVYCTGSTFAKDVAAAGYEPLLLSRASGAIDHRSEEVYENAWAAAKMGHDPAWEVLQAEGVTENDLRVERRLPKRVKINDVPDDLPFVVENHSVAEMGKDRARTLISILDMDYYLGFVANRYESNWMNGRH